MPSILTSTTIILNWLSMTLRSESNCIPICFRSKGYCHPQIQNQLIDTHAQIVSTTFKATWIATTNRMHPNVCSVTSVKDVSKCKYGFANRDNRGAEYIRTMQQAMKHVFGGDYDKYHAKLNILNIGHGLGYMTYLQQQSFPNALIDSMDIDDAMFTVSKEWFCWDTMTADKSKVNLITYDGIRYIRELWTNSSTKTTKQYDVINIDAYDSCNIVPFFGSKIFFQMIQDIWKRWDEIQCRTRMLVINAYYPKQRHTIKTEAYRNAVKVFGEDQVEAHAGTVLSVTSKSGSQCAVGLR